MGEMDVRLSLLFGLAFENKEENRAGLSEKKRMMAIPRGIRF